MEKLNIKEFLDQDEKKDLLRLLTAGSVDDGKSTLIGRLLFDSKNCMRTNWTPWKEIPNDTEMREKTSIMPFCWTDSKQNANKELP